MSNLKKIIGIVLALVMALSVASVAFAAEPDAYTVTITADKTELAAGESATVSVAVTSNYYVSAISIPVFFDNSQVTVSAGAINAAFTGKVSIATESSADIDKVYAGSGYDKATTGVRFFSWIATFGSTLVKYDNQEVMTFTVTANEDATGSVTLECVAGTQKTSTNPTGALYVLKNSTGNPTQDSLGVPVDNATITDATATINFAGGMEPADLELTAQGATDGVVIDTRITFGGQYDGVVYGFKHVATTTFRANTTYLTNSLTATNEGTLEFARSIGTAGWGTGTTITVKNSDGTDSGKVYVVVIFGDVNCDGLINANDTAAVKGYVANGATLTNKVVRMAANCQNIANGTMLYNVNANDTSAVKAYVGNTTAKVAQATLGATFKKTAVNANYA